MELEDLTRRQIRYLCFRIQSETEGSIPAAGEMLEEVRAHMESQEDFGGWKNFGKTWDVDENAKLVVVLRTSSIQSNWNKVVQEEAKDLPVTPNPTKETGIKGASKDKWQQKSPLTPPRKSSASRKSR